MTDYKQKQMEKERQKAINELLVSECKSPHANLDSIRTLLENGAQVGFKYCEALRRAVKNQNFALIRFLIENGTLEHEISFTYIAQICDHKFSDKIEPAFFEILDHAYRRKGDYMQLFTPYINNMAVHGRLDKIQALQKRYYLTEAEIVSVIELRVIFEIVLGNHDEILVFIEKHKNWFVQESYDLAVDSGEWIVLEYLLAHGGYTVPGDKSVGKAVYDGHLEVLELLVGCGYNFNRKPLFLEKACRSAFANGTRSLEYLLAHGYQLTDSYNGKTIAQHAVLDKNAPLLAFLQSHGIAAP